MRREAIPFLANGKPHAGRPTAFCAPRKPLDPPASHAMVEFSNGET